MEAGISVEIVNVTPAMARSILNDQKDIDGDLRQRRIDRHRVGQYAKEMRAGTWLLNGESVQFNGTRLLNGQHRLSAIVEADVVVPMLIVRGVDATAFSTIDQGKTRTLTNLLQMRGFAYKSEIASGGRLAMIYEKTGVGSPRLQDDRFSRHEIFDYIMANSEALSDAAILASNVGIAHRAMLTALAFLGRNRDEREGFFQRLKDGIELGATEPIHWLRDRLLMPVKHRNTIRNDYTLALAIKTWNATLRGEPMARLSFKQNEQYPVMIR